jgi:hypothetical protein
MTNTLIRKLIWHDLVDALTGQIFLGKYIYLHRTLKKIFNSITLIISISGILGWKQFQDYVFVALFIITAMQLLVLIENQLIKSDKELDRITKLRILYTRYLHEIEKLWIDFESELIENNEAILRYDKLRVELKEPIEELDSELHIKVWKKMSDKSDIEANKHLKQKYY